MLLAAAMATAQTKDEIRVYVYTAQASGNGFTDPGQKDREEAVAGLKRDLAKRHLAVVEDQASADFTAEILDRGQSTAFPKRSVEIGGGLTVQGNMADVHVKISAGDYSTIIEGVNDGRLLGAKGVALGKAANQIETWVKENRAKLLASRK
jgi:hypothetical protein